MVDLDKICRVGLSGLPYVFHLILLSLSASECCGAVPPTAEIIKKSDSVLAGPIRYRLRQGVVEAVVSRTVLRDGTKAIRVEPVTGSQVVLLVLGNKYYEVLPQSHVIIDKNHMQSVTATPLPAIVLAKNEMSHSLLPESRPSVERLFEQVETESLEGLECYRITREFDSPSGELKKRVGLSALLLNNFETKHSLIVDAATFEPILLKSFSANGELMASFEYVDVELNPTLPTGSFSLPDGYAVEIPQNQVEYFGLHERYWDDVRPVPKFRPIYPTASLQAVEENYKKLKERIKIQRDAETGIYHLPETSVAEAKAQVIAARKELKLEMPGRNGFRFLLVINIMLLLFGFVYYWRKRKSIEN